MSMIVAIPVLGSDSVIVWASRSSAQELPPGSSLIAMKLANCTNRNGKLPWPQSSRQFVIIAGKSLRY